MNPKQLHDLVDDIQAGDRSGRETRFCLACGDLNSKFSGLFQMWGGAMSFAVDQLLREELTSRKEWILESWQKALLVGLAPSSEESVEAEICDLAITALQQELEAIMRTASEIWDSKCPQYPRPPVSELFDLTSLRVDLGRSLRAQIRISFQSTLRATLQGGSASLGPAATKNDFPRPVASRFLERSPVNSGVGSGHVFISYIRENLKMVRRLRQDLIEQDISVWWDQDIEPGCDWRMAIGAALKGASGFVLCLSPEMNLRKKSEAFPEIRDAITIQRQRGPHGAFILPVRLANCEIPEFRIDSTSDLANIQRVDLFPEEARHEAILVLARALRKMTVGSV